MRARTVPPWWTKNFSDAVAREAMKRTTDIAISPDEKPRWHYTGPRYSFNARQWREWVLVKLANSEEAGTLR